MPKKLENVRELLIEEGIRLLKEEGYSKFTVRSVAKACGLGLGTVYNYFPSKDALIATYLWGDWKGHLTKMQASAGQGMERAECVYSHLQAFLAKYKPLFSDEKAKITYANASSNWHQQLIGQLVDVLCPACTNDKMIGEFLAEALLTWSVKGAEVSILAPILQKLI